MKNLSSEKQSLNIRAQLLLVMLFIIFLFCLLKSLLIIFWEPQLLVLGFITFFVVIIILLVANYLFKTTPYLSENNPIIKLKKDRSRNAIINGVFWLMAVLNLSAGFGNKWQIKICKYLTNLWCYKWGPGSIGIGLIFTIASFLFLVVKAKRRN